VSALHTIRQSSIFEDIFDKPPLPIEKGDGCGHEAVFDQDSFDTAIEDPLIVRTEA
jgi:hypothetical protein